MKVDGAGAFNRGGALRLGSVLTTTSAPLRTSPVKRGDWVLRRVLGTPTPPPPADAGTLPGDDKSFNGLTLRERLAEHKRNASCAACHLRIDPLGFPLEGLRRRRPSSRRPMPTASRSTSPASSPTAGPSSAPSGLLTYLKTPGQAGDDDAVAKDARLRARPDGAGVGPAAARRDGRRGRQRGILGSRGKDRDQPSVPYLGPADEPALSAGVR